MFTAFGNAVRSRYNVQAGEKKGNTASEIALFVSAGKGGRGGDRGGSRNGKFGRGGNRDGKGRGKGPLGGNSSSGLTQDNNTRCSHITGDVVELFPLIVLLHRPPARCSHSKLQSPDPTLINDVSSPLTSTKSERLRLIQGVMRGLALKPSCDINRIYYSCQSSLSEGFNRYRKAPRKSF